MITHCPACYEERAIPIAFAINYIGIDPDDSVLVNTPIHAVMCWNCGLIRILDQDEIKTIASKSGKVIVL